MRGALVTRPGAQRCATGPLRSDADWRVNRPRSGPGSTERNRFSQVLLEIARGSAAGLESRRSVASTRCPVAAQRVHFAIGRASDFIGARLSKPRPSPLWVPFNLLGPAPCLDGHAEEECEEADDHLFEFCLVR
jgi:hypothetical protein